VILMRRQVSRRMRMTTATISRRAAAAIPMNSPIFSAAFSCGEFYLTSDSANLADGSRPNRPE
jgi:hypothetical protein